MRAMILAAGRGERMRPLTDDCPKPLLQAGGRALIEWHILALRDAGVYELVINHAHLGHLLEAALGDGSALGVRIRYSPEKEALETAGGVRTALPLLGDQPFLVINGDIHTDFPLPRLIERAAQLAEDGDLAHLVLVPNPSHHTDGDFCLSAGRVRLGDTDRLTFSGIGAYHPALFGGLEANTRAPLGPLLREAIAAQRVSGEGYRGVWVDVGSPARLSALDRHLNDRPARS